MKYQKLCLTLFLSATVLTVSAVAQQPARIKRPVKNPPQYPNIIDLDNKDRQPKSPQVNQQPNAQDEPAAEPSDSLAGAVQTLANELRSLGQELRSLNIREQTQIEMLRMARVDLRIDHYERELRPVRERLAALEADQQILQQVMTREGLLAQTANTPTINREELMKQLKFQQEARYRSIQAEKERLQKLEADLTASLKIYQNMSREAEQKIQDAEETLKNIESGKAESNQQSPQGQTGQSAKNERKQ